MSLVSCTSQPFIKELISNDKAIREKYIVLDNCRHVFASGLVVLALKVEHTEQTYIKHYSLIVAVINVSWRLQADIERG